MNRVISVLLSSILGLVVLFNVGLHAQTESIFQIAYRYTNNHDICLINMDGTDNFCLTNTEDIIESNPIWSPDGLFLSYRSMEEPVGLDSSESFTYVYNFEEETTTQLPKAWYVYDWSPDGEFLLTVERTEVTDGEVAIVRPDGSGLRTLTDNEEEDSRPSWSPDGSQIAYFSGYPDAKLMVISASGDVQKAITDNLPMNRDVQPQWSPDGSTIAFSVNGEFVGTDQTSEIYLVQSDGSNLRQLTQTKGVTLQPRWSPDGKQLVFWGYEVGAFNSDTTGSLLTEVFRIDSDGSNLLNLTQSVGLDYQPDWSPDGQWIAFASVRVWNDVYGQPGIFIMRPDGSDVQMVTNEPPFSEGGRESNNPVWRPVGGG